MKKTDENSSTVKNENYHINKIDNVSKTVGRKKKETEKAIEKVNKEVEKKLRKTKKIKIEFDTKELDNKEEKVKNVKKVLKGSKLKVIPLGGLNEIGKNITAIEYEDTIVVIDCGLAFPEEDMLGVDLVIPDFTYLEKNKEKVKALLVTHGHEDHIGSIPYFLKKINVPIYGTKLTLGLINVKLTDHHMEKTSDLRLLNPREKIQIGKMEIEFIRVTHSIADSVAIAIKTPAGTIIHTGDFKIDYTPIDNLPMDFERFVEYGKEGVTLLIADSTNVERPGYTMSEKSIGPEFDKIFSTTKKRIIIATFASNIHRMQQIINSAVKYGRKVAVVGRSMLNVLKIATELGYITYPKETLIEIDKIGNYNPEQLVIITTGTQGEPMSALSRMSIGEHRKVNITPDDLVIFSSSAIPGNEKSIGRVMDELEKLGAEVIYNKMADVHVSGHACQEELKLMLSLIKPKFFMPAHGEYRFLKKHGEIAASIGIPKENIFIMENGRILELDNEKAKKGLQVPSGILMVDGLGVGDIGNIVLRDRQLLSENGMVIVIIALDRKTSNLVNEPEIVTRGFVYVRENEELMEHIKIIAKEEVELCIKNKQLEWSNIKNCVKDAISSYIYKQTEREPMVLPIISEVDMEDYIKHNLAGLATKN